MNITEESETLESEQFDTLNITEESETLESEQFDTLKTEDPFPLIYWIGVPLLLFIVVLIFRQKRIKKTPQNDTRPDGERHDVSAVLERIEEDIIQDYVSYHVFDLLLILGCTDVRKEMKKEFTNRAKPVIDWNHYLKSLDEETKSAVVLRIEQLAIDSDDIDNKLPWQLQYRELVSHKARDLAKLSIKKKLEDMGLPADVHGIV